MIYKLRIIELSNGKFRIQKKHWLLTFGFWWTLTNAYDDREYWETNYKEVAEKEIKKYYQVKHVKIVSIEEYNAQK